MSSRGARHLNRSGPRHSIEWYDQSDEPVVLVADDRLFIPCEGGPSASLLETFPPRLEVPVQHGLYVLDDTGPRDHWRYRYLPLEP